MALVENVTFLYCKIQSPVLAWNKVDTEWCVDVVMSKADAKKIKKEYPKTSLKEYDNADFTEKFSIEPSFPSQDEQFIVKFKKAHVKAGKETPEKYRPRVIQAMEDGSREDITFEKLVANGSTGTLSYRIKETDTYGNFVELQAIMVTDLIEYQGKGGVTDEFGPVTLKDAPVQEKVVVKQGDKEVELTKAAPAQQDQPKFDSFDDDTPFAPIGLQEGRMFVYMI